MAVTLKGRLYKYDDNLVKEATEEKLKKYYESSTPYLYEGYREKYCVWQLELDVEKYIRDYEKFHNTTIQRNYEATKLIKNGCKMYCKAEGYMHHIRHESPRSERDKTAACEYIDTVLEQYYGIDPLWNMPFILYEANHSDDVWGCSEGILLPRHTAYELGVVKEPKCPDDPQYQ